MYKKFIKLPVAIITLCIVLFNYTCNCYAVSSNVTVDSWMQQLGDAVRTFTITLEAGEHVTSNALREYVKKSFDSVGFMIDETGVLLEKIKTAIHGVDSNFDLQNSDEDDVAQWIVDNTEVINGDVVFGDKYNSFIKEYNDNFIEESTGKTYYCCDLQQSQQYFTTDEIANISGILQEYPNYIFYLFYNYSDNSNWLLGLSPNGGQLYGVCRVRYNNQDDWWSCIFYRAKSVNGIVSCERFVANSSDDMVAFYRRSGTTDDFEQFQLTYPWTGTTINGHAQPYDSCYLNSSAGQSVDGNNFAQYPKGITMTNQSLLCFSSDSALQTYVNTYGIGKQAYYYNNQVWSNFVDNSSGDYTVTTSNVNTVTYGDTVSYINDYHDTNNNYPDNSTVNNWINTTNNNNGSGGGSGGSGGDSGDSGSGIVSILTALGKAIADLITGIVAFLAEVVGGLVEAITGLLDTLTDLITNFTESIPNIFSPLLGWLFDGLPEEFTAIILLGLTACVIASIIKILRG